MVSVCNFWASGIVRDFASPSYEMARRGHGRASKFLPWIPTKAMAPPPWLWLFVCGISKEKKERKGNVEWESIAENSHCTKGREHYEWELGERKRKKKKNRVVRLLPYLLYAFRRPFFLRSHCGWLHTTATENVGYFLDFTAFLFLPHFSYLHRRRKRKKNFFQVSLCVLRCYALLSGKKPIFQNTSSHTITFKFFV